MPEVDPNLWAAVLLVAGYLLARMDKRGEQANSQGTTLVQVTGRVEAIEKQTDFWNTRAGKVATLETKLDAIEQRQFEHQETLKGWDTLVAEVTHMREAMDRLLTSVETLYQTHAVAPPPARRSRKPAPPKPAPARGSRRKRA